MPVAFTRSELGELDALIEQILIDSYGEGEDLSAFLNVLADELECPLQATLLGATVTVTKFGSSGNDDRPVATCTGAHGTGEVDVADLIFVAGTVAAWLHAAYRRHLGRKPFSAVRPPDWSL